MVHWYWSHDIPPHQVADVAMPGFRLIRLARYDGFAGATRFAAVCHRTPGPPRDPVLDLTAEELSGVAGRPVGVTVDATRAEPRFSLVREPAGAGTPTTVHAGLDAAALHELGGRILDLDTYVTAGGRRYAAVVARDDGPPSLVFTDVTRRHLTGALRRHGAVPTAVRPAGDGRFAAAATPGPEPWRWYAGIDADTVAGKLDRRRAYPADLDAVRTGQGVRYTAIVRFAK